MPAKKTPAKATAAEKVALKEEIEKVETAEATEAPEAPVESVEPDQVTILPEEATSTPDEQPAAQDRGFKSVPAKTLEAQEAKEVKFRRQGLKPASNELQGHRLEFPRDYHGVTGELKRVFMSSIRRAKGHKEKTEVLHSTVKVLVSHMLKEADVETKRVAPLKRVARQNPETPHSNERKFIGPKKVN